MADVSVFPCETLTLSLSPLEMLRKEREREEREITQLTEKKCKRDEYRRLGT